MTLYKNAVYLFAGLIVLIFLGFWPGYFAKISSVRLSLHVHGLLMLLWMGLLITQAWFVRTGRMDQHRLLGKASFVIAPLMVWAGVMIANEFVNHPENGLAPHSLMILTLPLYSITQFALTYALAIYYRRQTELHARFMISTSLILAPAASFRVFLNWVPGLGTVGAAGNATFVMFELIAIALILNDRRLGRVRAPFIMFLGLFAINHLFFVSAPDLEWWRTFATNFMAMSPLAPWAAPG